jgi:hypothetical protein
MNVSAPFLRFAGLGSLPSSASRVNAPATRYVCATAGAETLVLTVDDHHVPASCTTTFLLPVTRLPKGDAGS